MHDALADDALAIDGMDAGALPLAVADGAEVRLPLLGFVLRALVGAVAVLVAIPALVISMTVATLVIVISPLAALFRPS